MQQPQSRPLLGDSVSSTTSPTARRNNPVAVLTQQQLQQLQQLHAQNSGPQSLTFTLQQTHSGNQDQANGPGPGSHILYVNQLNQLNQGPLNPSGTGMGLPPATPTFGVGLNMGLPLSLLNTSLASLNSNAVSTSNSLLNLSLPSISSGLTAINPSLNHLNALGANLSSNLSSDNISNGLSNLGQDLTGMSASINRLGALNPTSINSGLSNISAGLTSVNPNLTTLNTTAINQNLASINANLGVTNSAAPTLNTNLNPNLNLSSNNINSALNQSLNRSVNAIANFSSANSNAQFPFQTIQSIQSIAPHIVGSNIAHVTSTVSQNQSNNITSTVQSTNSGSPSLISHSTTTSTGSMLASSNNAVHVSNANQQINVAQFGIMSSSMPNIISSQQLNSNDINPNSSINPGFSRQFSTQSLNQAINTNQATNSIISNMKTVQSVQGQSSTSPGSPFSVPMKSPACNIAPPTPSPSPNRLLLRSPAPNSIQSRNSPSPVSISTSNANFSVQLQSPMQSPISVSQIQSPVPSPYPPAKSPLHLNTGATMNNKSPVPGGSPGPPVVRPNTPIMQQGMQVLQIIHPGAPQGYQQTSQLVTRTHLFGNQQIQIATKPNKQPQQILPKPPLQQTNVSQPKQRATTTTITNQVPQQTQPQLVLASPQPNPSTATMIPTAPGLLLNQVGPVIVQQQPGGVQLILRTPANAQQHTHTAQLTQQQLVRVVTSQGMQLQGLGPTFFAVPNNFSSPAPPMIRHTPSSPAPTNTNNNGQIVIQNAMVQNSQPQIATQHTTINAPTNIQNVQTIVNQNLLPPPKKKAKKKKKMKKKDEQPKLDLASLIKISGIGDDDDMFENDLATEAEVPAQQEVNTVQSSPLLSMPNTCVQSNVVQVPASNAPEVIQTSPAQDSPNTLVTQVQAPIQNAITGQLRLAVSEDGRFILHHTPEPNQPEIDQATAEALIRSLTQGGQNSQIISQLMQTKSAIQTSQNTVNNRQKFDKAPMPNVPMVGPTIVNQTSSQPPTAIVSPQQIKVNSNVGSFQNMNATAMSQVSQSMLTGAVQASNVQSVNVVAPTVTQPIKTVARKCNSKKQITIDCKSASQKLNTQIVQPTGQNQIVTVNKNQVNNIQQIKLNQQTKAPNICINMNQQQSVNKQTIVQLQKPFQNPTNIQYNTQFIKNNQNQYQQINIAELDSFGQQQSLTLSQQNIAQQISASQTVQTQQNLQAIFEQNLQKNVNATLQQTSTDGIKVESVNIVQQTTAGNLHQSQQQMMDSLQQNISGNMQSINPTQMHFSNSLQKPVKPNTINTKQQKTKAANAVLNNQSLEMFASQNLPTNILISNSPCAMQQQQQQQQQEQSKPEPQNICNSNAAASILNNAPKITPEILNALSNLNPNDQLLIANANGQMQVISQQLLQQFLTNQFNAQVQAQVQAQNQAQTQNQAQVQHQNQTQKIVIGEPSSNNPSMQEVQINTPTSQIIVNSSGGAPTIQNNIQNIVVQAAPTQMPQQIQIQNSGFPNQFIDNLNQQQIRNLGNNVATNHNVATNQSVNQSAPKKAKIVKRTKVVTIAQQQQTAKSVSVTRPVVVSTSVTTSTTTTTSVSSIKKSEPINKTSGQTIEINKSDAPQFVTVNGPHTSLSAGCQVPILSTGQVHRVRTIQLTAQKQQMLTTIQAQIQTILARRNHSPEDNDILTQLYQEQTRIIASGKLISSTSHPINNESETTLSMNVASTKLTSRTISQTACKSQTSTATQTPNTNSNPVISNVQNVQLIPSSNNLFTPNLAIQVQSPLQPAVVANKPLQSQEIQKDQDRSGGIENGLLLVPSSLSADNFSNSKVGLESQQSTQCQSEADVKPVISGVGPDVKADFSFPIQQQQQQVQVHHNHLNHGQHQQQHLIQSIPPAGQVINQRIVSKSAQSSQTKLLSPESATSPRQGVKRTSSSSPVCRQINRTDLFENQLKIDQNGALNPDVNTPFQNKRDACKRLVRYHCFNEQVLSTKDLEKADEIFEETAKHLLGKFNSMVNKYSYLLIMDSMRETRTSELMMIDRMIVNEEQVMLNRLREQETKQSSDAKTEDKLLVPKVEPIDEEAECYEGKGPATSASSASTAAAAVKLELDMDVGLDVGVSLAKSADYDEWLEIQKELGVYSSADLKCSASGGNKNNKSCRTDRARANGEVATELERDLLEDTAGLEGLAFYAQAQCSSHHAGSERQSKPDVHDEITAQVQATIDSILSLKKRPAQPSGGGGGSQEQQQHSDSASDESDDKLLDQAVRSILGS